MEEMSMLDVLPSKSLVLAMMRHYAKIIVDVQLEVAAEEAYCDLVHPPTDEYPDLEESEVLVCKDSIRNCTRIELI